MFIKMCICDTIKVIRDDCKLTIWERYDLTLPCVPTISQFSTTTQRKFHSFQSVVKELKVALSHERFRRDTLKTEMSAELQAKAQELSELRRTIQGVGLKSTAQEIEEALASMEHQGEVSGNPPTRFK